MIRVLVVDDSALVRKMLTDFLDAEPDIRVIATASDPYAARRRLLAEMPDVITLDIEMPRMDGLTFLGKLMAWRPVPVVIVSSLSRRGAEVTLKALAAGAVDTVAKPSRGLRTELPELRQEIVDKVRAAARSRVRRPPPVVGRPEPRHYVEELVPRSRVSPRSRAPVIVIGASTGGTAALEVILRRLPATLPGIVVVQHMPAAFTVAFASRLDSVSALRVRHGEEGLAVRPGEAVLAPGGCHTLLQRSGSGYRIELRQGPPVNRHRPSVDVLFRSTANCAGGAATAVLLTGMGDDGARGMLDLHELGARTIAQDEASCVVYGMPRSAVERGAVQTTASLEAIGELLAGMAQVGGKRQDPVQ